MLKIYFNILLVTVFLSTFSCQEPALVKEDNSLPEFDEIVARIPGNYILRSGSESSIRIVSKKDDVNDITYEVKDGVLRIGEFNSGTEINGNEVSIIVTSTSYRRIHLWEDIDMTVEGALEAEQLEIIVEDFADIQLPYVSVKDLSLQMLSYGSIIIEDGTAENGEILVNRNGNGRIETYGLSYQNCNIVIEEMGSGITEVFVTDELIVELSDNSDGLVYYKGEPKIAVFGEDSRVIEQ